MVLRSVRFCCVCIKYGDTLNFYFFKLNNSAKVISYLTNIESVHFLLFLITYFLLTFKRKEILLRISNTSFFVNIFLIFVRLKIYVNILSIIATAVVGISESLSFLVYHHCLRSLCF